MQYIVNLTDEPKQLPSQIGATVINNPDEATIRSLGFIPIVGNEYLNDFESEAPKKVTWLRNEETNKGVIAVYNVELDQDAIRNQAISEENTRYFNQLEEGFDTGLDFNISMHKNARDLFREIMDGITYAQLPDTYLFDRLMSVEGSYHTVTIKQMKEIAKGYSIACMQVDGLNDYNLNNI